MTTIMLNGVEEEFDLEFTLFDLIRYRGVHPERVVAQVNEEIIAKDKYNQYQIKDGDRVDLVKFMAGG